MDEMVLFYPEGHEKHSEYGHPERPERVETIRKALRRAGWWDVFPHFEPHSIKKNVLETVHNPAYLAWLENASASGQRLDMDTYTTPASWELACNAAGGAIAVAKGFNLKILFPRNSGPFLGTRPSAFNVNAVPMRHVMCEECGQMTPIADPVWHGVA